jgi:hypothetical protein
MFKRFVIAILNILITALKFLVNMMTIGISFLTKKEIPLVDDWTPSDNSDEKQEAFERQRYVVEHSPYDSPIKY